MSCALIPFLDWLTVRNLTLAACRQNALDAWITSGQARYRRETGHFIRWATKQKLTSLGFPATRRGGPSRVIDTAARWDLARRLLHDDSLDPEDRVAGLHRPPLLRPGPPTALFQLATDLPAAVLARMLGIHITVTVTWQCASAGDWTANAAEISRRSPRSERVP